jgi:simple sugar transport system ATP-binding protein
MSAAGAAAPGGAPGAAPAIALRGIEKRFGAVRANRAVDLDIGRGSIHGIVGENGAGKSTLMKILYGYYRADAGRILVGGRAVDIAAPADAIRCGIGMIHQHFMLVEPFTVLENLVLGAEDRFWVRASFAAARAALAEIERQYGLEVDPDAVVGELPVGLQQRVEILKILFRGAEVVILDEPTAVLTPQETDELFKILRRLQREGKTVVLITHKLQEIMAVTDRVTVMRDGAVVGTLPTAGTSREQLAELMVGRKVLLRVEKQPAAPGAPLLEVDGLTVHTGSGAVAVDDVSFDVRAGEILGVAGVSGNGQSELIEALAGLRPIARGRVRILGREVAGSDLEGDPSALRRLGVGHVPEDRLRMGVIEPF